MVEEIHVFDKDSKRGVDAADHLLASGTQLPPTTDENYFSEFVGDVLENFKTAYKKHEGDFEDILHASHTISVQEMLHSAYEFTMKEWEFQQRTYAKRKGMI